MDSIFLQAGFFLIFPRDADYSTKTSKPVTPLEPPPPLVLTNSFIYGFPHLSN